MFEEEEYLKKAFNSAGLLNIQNYIACYLGNTIWDTFYELMEIDTVSGVL